MKKLIIQSIMIFVLLTMLFSLPVTASAETRGTCGTNLTWVLDDEGTLTISGTGSMTDYTSSTTPWSASIESVIIEEGVTSIGAYAFYSCPDLTSITLPQSLTSIGKYAFCYCSNMQAVYAPSLVSWLNISFADVYATPLFNNDAALYLGGVKVNGSLVIPEGVTRIGYAAFYCCDGLTSITFPKSLTSVEGYAFARCPNLTSIYAPSLKDWLNISFGSSVHGGSTRKLFFDGVELGSELVIPAGVTHIGSYAFANQTALTSVTFPQGLTSIGEGAFEQCKNLTSITLPSSLTTVGDYAFVSCYNVQAVHVSSLEHWFSISFGRKALPENLTSKHLYVNNKPLSELTGAVVIPEGVTAIPAYTFSDCASITSVTLPSTLTAIGEYAFSWCSSLTTIKIPDGVTSIGSCAFAECSALSSVTLPSGLTSVSSSLFSSCSSLTTISIPDSVISIGESAFSRCSNLSGITLGKNLTSIGKSAFYGCSALSGITLPQGLTSIGSHVFWECTSLTSIVIPEGVTRIEQYTFFGCNSLASITLPSSLKSVDKKAFDGTDALKKIHIASIASWASCRVTYDTDETTPVNARAKLYLNGKELSGSIVIPEGVESIAPYAFYNCTGITSVTFPQTLDSIGINAFHNCNNIKEVHISSLETWLGLPDYDDRYYDGLRLMRSGAKLYLNGKELAGRITLSSTTYKIPAYAFRGCSGITSISIPSSVSQIGSYAFDGCTSLTSITLPTKVTSIPQGVFSGCTGLTSVSLPEKLSTIEYLAFENCRSLSRITIPEGVTSIHSSAFSGCSSLTELHVASLESWLRITANSSPYNAGCILNSSRKLYLNGNPLSGTLTLPDGLTSIPEYAFYGCSGLTGIVFPDSITSIGAHAFNGCSGLTSIDLPEALTTVETAAFRNCSSVTRITIPQSVTRIKSGAFYNCKNLKEVHISSLESWLKITEYKYNSDTGAQMLSASGVQLYLNGKTLSGTLTIPQGITHIPAYAFYGCTGITGIDIPEGVVSIGVSAFSNCSSVTRVSLPASLTSDSSGSFDFGRDSPVPEVHIASLESWLKCGASASLMGYRSNGQYPGLYLNGKQLSGAITIPAGLTSIPENAFSGCSGITSITIPNTVTSIDNSAFAYCTGLTSITIPSSVTSISHWVFYHCANLASITLPDGLTTLGGAAFRSCESLTSINIPAGITQIENGTFYDCTALTNINIPSGVTTIEDEAFAFCGLTSIQLPSGITSIGGFAFGYCSSLGSISIPSSVTTIEDQAFASCGLTSIQLPSSITSIGIYAFGDCFNLSSISIPSGVTSIGEHAFRDCPALTDATIPAWMVSDTHTISDYFGAENKLQKITVQGSCPAISAYAFANCKALSSVSLPEDVSSFGAYAFAGCSSLKEPIFHAGMTQIGEGVFSGCTALGSVVIPAQVTSIGASAFEGCTSLGSIDLPDALTSIAANAFSGCKALGHVFIRGEAEPVYDLSSIPGPFTIYCYEYTPVDFWAMANGYEIVYLDSMEDSTLVSFTLECPVTELEKGTTCVITPVIVPAQEDPIIVWSSSAPDVASVENGLVTGLTSGKATITAVCMGSTASLDIEVYETIDSLGWLWSGDIYLVSKETIVFDFYCNPATARYDCTFSVADEKYACITDVTKTNYGYRVSLQGNLIGQTTLSYTEAYSGWNGSWTVFVCYPVTDVSMETNTLELLTGHGHALKVNVTTRSDTYVNRLITFSSSNTGVVYVNQTGSLHAWQPGTATITATASNGISDSCVITVRDPKTSVLPANLIEIGDSAFANTAAECYVLPNGVTTIGSRAFANCPNLREIRIPASVTSIADDAFAGCTGLTIMCPINSTAHDYGYSHGFATSNWYHMD